MSDELLTAADADRLVGKLDVASGEMAHLNTRLDRAQEKAAAAEKVARSARKVVVAAVILTLIAIGTTIVTSVFLYAIADESRSNKAATERLEDVVAEIEASRQEARTTACIRDNVDTFNDRKTLTESLLELVDPGVVLTADQEAKVARYRAKVEELQPFRDCSKAGIDAWYANPPADPAVN